MFNKSFEELTLKDVERLREHEVAEGKSLEYKSEMHLENSSAKKEFATDVTSFANTNGGDLLVGVEENGGVISKVQGYEFGNHDTLRLQIENLLRDMVEPRITGLRMQFYEVDNSRSILHLSIPKSYIGPHIVNGKRFFGRNSAGKYPLDYAEIRNKFLMQSDLGNKIRDYHAERVMKIKANSGYLPLVDGASILIQVIPLQTLAYDSPSYDVGHPQNGSFRPFFASGWDFHIGFEGIAAYAGNQQEIYSYHHFDRKGITEIVDKAMLNFNTEAPIVIQPFEERLVKVLNESKKNYDKLNIHGPYAILLSLLDVKDYELLYGGTGTSLFRGERLRQQDLLFPEVVLNDLTKIEEKVQPFINLMCNAAGLVKRP